MGYSRPFKSLFVSPDSEAAFNVWVENNRELHELFIPQCKQGSYDWKVQYIFGCLFGFEPPSKKQSRCKNCYLYRTSYTCKVRSRGSENPLLLLVGEAPGPEEDISGTCFVGKAGKLLDEIIRKCNLPPEFVRITNVVRCILWGGDGKIRAPYKEEMLLCAPYLWDEIQKYMPDYCPSLPIFGDLETAWSGEFLESIRSNARRWFLMLRSLTRFGGNASTRRVPRTFNFASEDRNGAIARGI